MRAAVKWKAHPKYLEAFGEIMSRIERSLGGRTKGPVPVYVAGGAALHLYTGARFSDDIDARIMLDRYVPPNNLEVAYQDPTGRARLLYFDTSYNETFALLHEDVHDDSIPVAVRGVNRKKLDVRVFSPVDLAVSKLSRFEGHDQEDILALAREGLIDSASLRARAEEALPGYVGELKRVRNSIDIACRKIDALELRPKPG